MAFIKNEAYAYGTDADGQKAFAEWFLGKLTARGWTAISSTNYEADNEIWIQISRTVTCQDGTVLPYFLTLEVEYTANDWVWHAWNGTETIADMKARAPDPLTSSSSFPPFFSTEGGLMTVWFDDASDGFLFLTKTNKVMGMQFPDGGWINDGLNDNNSYASGTRPNWITLPMGTSVNGSGMLLQDSSTEYVYNGIVPRVNGTPNVWTDYCALRGTGGSSTIGDIVWEDLTGTWKMQAQTNKNYQTVSVVKIDSEYYLNTGQFLLPAGTTEPELS